MTIAVIDIDGVVADVRHRVHHLDPPASWGAFFAGAGADPLLAEGAALVAELAAEHEIVWLSGRPERLRRVTTQWLARHALPAGELHLRSNRDFRPARRYKLQVLTELAPRHIALLVDDDAAVIEAAAAAGMPTLLAAWAPRGARLRAAQDDLGRT